MTSQVDRTRSPRAVRWARALLRSPTLHFFVLGLAALLVQRTWLRATAERPTLLVLVPPGLTPDQQAQRVDAAILVEEGLALGWARTDPVIRERLVTNLRFARGQTLPEGSGAAATPAGASDEARDPPASQRDDAALIDEALRLGMDRSDLIVRRRVVSRAEHMLTSDVRNTPVDDATLLAFRDAHPERFRAPGRYRYADIFLSRQRHGSNLTAAAEAMGARLAAGGVTSEQASALSDPLLYTPGDRWVSADEVNRRLGGELSARLADAPLATWAGPFASSFGLHYVWVRERRAAALLSLEVARARILGAYRDERQEAAMRARKAELRSHYDITVEVREGAP